MRHGNGTDRQADRHGTDVQGVPLSLLGRSGPPNNALHWHKTIPELVDVVHLVAPELVDVMHLGALELVDVVHLVASLSCESCSWHVCSIKVRNYSSFNASWYVPEKVLT